MEHLRKIVLDSFSLPCLRKEMCSNITIMLGCCKGREGLIQGQIIQSSPLIHLKAGTSQCRGLKFIIFNAFLMKPWERNLTLLNRCVSRMQLPNAATNGEKQLSGIYLLTPMSSHSNYWAFKDMAMIPLEGATLSSPPGPWLAFKFTGLWKGLYLLIKNES